ncbi:hypothetical protein CLV24_105111 [Pontibacter ummariensis]|uniref:Uncharacterized protein n=1 Tax=Pontibacter ummariensis TaxID=1610492 RepID=A0A239DX63_9BACT|nr:hypothetical protein [Pontibacter ummariensis]PRY13741.1 hypothetical protein CLV24_105111 [Pontibacter ummariensis]SNS36292.1 hypothetical protein SAMN06296052_105140 [Pontibacter ummariensis]
MSKKHFRIERVADAPSLEKTFEPTLQLFKGKGLPVDKVMGYLRDTTEFDLIEKEYLRYVQVRQEIEALLSQGQTWQTVYDSAVSRQELWTLEAFLDAIEAQQGSKIESIDHLSGITEIEDREALASVVTHGRESKYLRALRKAIEDGAVLSDLQQVEPAGFGLAPSWTGSSGEEANKQTMILWAIGEGYVISFRSYDKVSPHLRSIANDLNAPYSVVIDAFEAYHERRKTLHAN